MRKKYTNQSHNFSFINIFSFISLFYTYNNIIIGKNRNIYNKTLMHAN